MDSIPGQLAQSGKHRVLFISERTHLPLKHGVRRPAVSQYMHAVILSMLQGLFCGAHLRAVTLWCLGDVGSSMMDT